MCRAAALLATLALRLVIPWLAVPMVGIFGLQSELLCESADYLILLVYVNVILG